MFKLITGGSGSGKSAFAEECIVNFGEMKRIYIATMFPFDKESEKRIERHRQMRAGKGFETIECYTNLKNLQLPSDCVVLLECMSNLVANEMFQENGAHECTIEEIVTGIENIRMQAAHLIVVTNEIFSEAQTYEGDTNTYQRYLGIINQKLAELADEVIEVVYGIPIEVKNEKFMEQF